MFQIIFKLHKVIYFSLVLNYFFQLQLISEKEAEQAGEKAKKAADNQTVAQTKVDDVIQRTGVPQSGAVQEQDVARLADVQQQHADNGAVVEARARTQTSKFCTF